MNAANLWDGGGADGNWTTVANWDNNTLPAATGQTLTFAGTLQLSTNNDSAITSVNGFTFNAGAGAFTLAGNALSLNGNIANNSTNLQTISLGLGFVNNVAVTGAGTGASVTLGTVTNSGGNRTLTNSLSSGNTLSIGGINLSNDATARTLTINGTGTTTVTGIIANGGAGAGILTYSGTGLLTLQGANTYTGASNFSLGSVNLDYSTQDNSKLADAAVLTLGGATVNLVGGTHTESVGSTTLNAGGTKINRTSGSSVLELNAITRGANSGATLNVGTAGIATTDTTNTNGILGGYATVGGTDWAMNSTNGANGAITALSTYTTLDNSAGTDTANSLQSDGATLTGSRTTNSLKVATTTTGQSLDVGAGNTLTLTSGGLLFTGTNNYAINNGTLRGNSASTGDLVVHQQGTGELTIGSIIANNTGASGLTKVGTGTLVIGGANTYTGGTFINEGTVRLNVAQNGTTSGAFGTGSSALLMQSGTTLDLNGKNLNVGTFSVAGGAGTGATISSADAATLTFGGAANLTGLTVTGNTLLDIKGGLTLGATQLFSGTGGTLQLSANVGRQNTIGTVLGNATLILNGVTNFQNTGGVNIAGNLVVNNTNTWNYQSNVTVAGSLTGAGTLNANIGFTNRSLSFNGDATGFTGTLAFDANNAGTTLNFGNATNVGAGSAKINLTNSATTTGFLQYTGGGTKTVALGELSGVSGWTVQNTTASTTATWQIGGLNTSTTFAGVIANGTGTSALDKVGTGTLTLSGLNSYTGGTRVSAGTLNYGANFTMSGANRIDIASAGVAGVNYGTLTSSVGNTVTFGGTLEINITASLVGNQTFNLFQASGGALAGDFSLVSIGGSYVAGLSDSGGTWTGSVGGVDFSFVSSSGILSTSAIPEPSTYAAIFGALALAGAMIRRRRSATV